MIINCFKLDYIYAMTINHTYLIIPKIIECTPDYSGVHVLFSCIYTNIFIDYNSYFYHFKWV